MIIVFDRLSIDERDNYQEWVVELLKSSIMTVVFNKKDGSERTMKCTLMQEALPVILDKSKSTKAKNPDVCPVFDIENNAWRSFRFDSIIRVELDG